ncbi:MAG: radical SAM protein [Myxococcota bacterium]|nr:radical SAM protein [Myxococcota bacterium]
MPDAPKIAHEHASTWNRRFVLRLHDGAEVEAVLYRGDTLCISCQVGCAVRCPFCASGADGLQRPLELAEMIAQIERVEAEGVALRGVTVSGIGEPLHNATAVEQLVSWCRDRATPASVTTSGGPTARLGAWLRDAPEHPFPHHGITISVHAGREPTRARLVPKGPPLAELFAAIEDALPAMSRRRRKKTALAYLLIEGENDDEGELDAFAARAAPLGLAVHLYALNPVPTSAMRGPARARYEAVYARLRASGLTVRMSSQARIEANGGCGTLVALRRRDPLRASTLAPDDLRTSDPRNR